MSINPFDLYDFYDSFDRCRFLTIFMEQNLKVFWRLNCIL